MPNSYPSASLRRRFAAILYDFFLIFALWALTGTLLQAGFGSGAPADANLPETQPLAAIWVQIICYGETLLFYLYFWRVKGQSLGMQVWKIQAVNAAGELLSTRQALLRFACATVSMAPFALGLFWALFNKERLAAHDIWSNSRVVYLGKKPYPSEQV
jgi:uncharacterized RDD family membrane protein YckC